MIVLSIIIVSWNVKNFLKNCIESVIEETLGFITEIIVIDNASTDGSANLVETIFPQVTIFKNSTNMGFAKGCNIGIKKSSGKYVCLINPDVVILKDCFKIILPYIEQNPKIGIIGPKILNNKMITQRSCMGFPTLWNQFCYALTLDSLFPKIKIFGNYLLSFWPHNTIRKVDVINGCFWLVRKVAINQVGLLDDIFYMYAEDKDWCKRFWKAGWEIVFYPKAKVIHYGGKSSAYMPIRNYIEMTRANLQYWKKYHNKISQICFFVITWIHQLIRIIGYSIIYLILTTNRATLQYKIRSSSYCIKWLLHGYKKLDELIEIDY